MGFFTWLGSQVGCLIDQMIDWLGEVCRWFIESLINALEKIWNTVIASALYAAFGAATIFNVIFYAGTKLGETIMEVWDPLYPHTKPSKVFKLQQAPRNSPLPTQRSEAEVLRLEN
ncbi:MAG: hypothetical protein HC836_46035 [Richelia sp. RM2_1_2]|nr:hypothetical protein [Richelia sp. RM2_1_2]